VVLCEGLKGEDDNALLDPQKEPFSKFKPTEIKPSLNMLKEEILGRYRLKEPDDNILGPRPKHWVKDQDLKWLHDTEADVLFLQPEVEQHRQATASARSTAATENISLSNWTGNVPHLRLIHCVVDDRIKDLYRRRDNLQPGRMTVNSRNSSVREETVWEKISNLWNDGEFEPDTMIMTGLHPNDFQTSEKLSFHRKLLQWRHPFDATHHHNHETIVCNDIGFLRNEMIIIGIVSAVGGTNKLLH
jgi:hypothetical protein